MQRVPLFGLFALVFSFSGIQLGAIEPAPKSTDLIIPSEIRIVTLRGPTGIAMMNLLEQRKLVLNDGRTIPLNIEIAATPDIIDARFAAHQIEAATLPVNQVARLYNRGVRVRLAGVNIWGVLYIVSNDKNLSTWAGLKSKHIYSTGKGATPDFVMRKLATVNGLDPDRDFTLDYHLGQVEIAQLLISGKIEIACLPEPFVARVLLKNPSLAINIDLQAEWMDHFGKSVPLAQGGIALSTEFSQKYPETARQLLHAYSQSCLDVSTDPQAPQRIEALGLGIDAISLKTALPRLNLRWEPAASAQKSVEQFLKIFLEMDHDSIGGKLPDATFYFQ